MPIADCRSKLTVTACGNVNKDGEKIDLPILPRDLPHDANPCERSRIDHQRLRLPSKASNYGRQITNTYDALYRRTLVEETSGGADIAAWEFYGPSRVAEVTLGNGLIQTFMNNDRTRSAIQEGESTPGWGDNTTDRLGYDGAGRMITKRYLAGGIDGGSGAYNDATAVVGQTTQFDKASNKLFERELQAESRSHLYQPVSGAAVPDDSGGRLRFDQPPAPAPPPPPTPPPGDR